MVLITGNFEAHSDFQRRIVNINLVQPDAYPEKRSLQTRKHCNQHRDAIVTAALATLGAFVATGEKHSTSDRTSYGVWDDLVRGCVLWLNAKGIATAELGDPLAANS